MRVTIKLFATLRQGMFDEAIRDVPEGTTIGELIDGLNLAEGHVTLVFLNGRHSGTGASLSDGDVVSLFPPIGGG